MEESKNFNDYCKYNLQYLQGKASRPPWYSDDEVQNKVSALSGNREQLFKTLEKLANQNILFQDGQTCSMECRAFVTLITDSRMKLQRLATTITKFNPPPIKVIREGNEIVNEGTDKIACSNLETEIRIFENFSKSLYIVDIVCPFWLSELEAKSQENLQDLQLHPPKEVTCEFILEDILRQPSSAEAIVHEFKNSSSKGLKPANIIVYTDIGADIDDACFLITLAYLHKIRVANVLMVVVNVKPTLLRAKAAKFIFEQIGADIPVATGTDGTNKEIELKGYEFNGLGEPEGPILDGSSAVLQKLQALEQGSEKCNIIVIASLRDLSNLVKQHESLVKNTVSSIFFQGLNEVDKETQTIKTLVPDMTSMNNTYDPEATIFLHDWLRGQIIPTYTSTRFSAFKAPVSAGVFQKAAKNGSLVGKYIYDAFGEQEREYYNAAANDDPSKRFMPRCDKKWYTMRTSWPDTHGEDELPETFEEIQPYTRMTLYDVVAGLICPLLNYDFVEEIYYPHKQTIDTQGQSVDHYIIGRSVDGSNQGVIPDVNTELLSALMTELLKEALEL